jgi:hypothetical protein
MVATAVDGSTGFDAQAVCHELTAGWSTVTKTQLGNAN